MASAAAAASATAGATKLARAGFTPPTAPRSNCAGRVLLAPLIAPQLAAKLISTPNKAAWPSASHCGLASGVTGKSGPASLATRYGAAAPTASPARMASPAITPSSISSIAWIVRRGAPTSFKMAMLWRREAAKAAAALDMPSPPIASADSATISSNLPEPVDEPPRAVAGVVAVGRAPAAIGKALLEGVADGLRVGAFGQEQAVRVLLMLPGWINPVAASPFR